MKLPLTTTQAAAALGVSRRRVLALLAAGRLKGEQHGRDWMIDPASVAKFKPLPAGWRKGRKRKG